MGALSVGKSSAASQSSPNIEESTLKRSLTSVRSVEKPFVTTVNAGLMNENTLGRSPMDVGIVGKLSRIDTALPSIKESTLERNLINVLSVVDLSVGNQT